MAIKDLKKILEQVHEFNEFKLEEDNENKKEEVYIAGAKEKLGVYAKRFYPKFLSTMIRKLSVT